MTAQILSPEPGDVIEVEGRRYHFAAHPGAPRMAFALEASRATVYQMRAADGSCHALKVFKPRFRSPALVEGTRHLSLLRSLPGLRAAERWIVTRPPREYPDLQYAVFIPWIHGSTWADLLMTGRQGATLGLDDAVQLADRFLSIIETLQARGIAHADLSPANVVLDLRALDVQLVDLEDIYTPAAAEPLVPSRGSRGYQHPSGETCWSADGDRYAAAVLAAEILLSIDAQAMQFATDEYCFGPNRQDQQTRTEFLRQRLRLVYGAFARSFDRAWESATLADCPSASELRLALLPLRRQFEAGIRWVAREQPVPPQTSPAVRPHLTPALPPAGDRSPSTLRPFVIVGATIIGIGLFIMLLLFLLTVVA